MPKIQIRSPTYAPLLDYLDKEVLQLFSQIYLLDEVNSTNSFLEEECRRGAAQPLALCLADTQTHGKGRLGRTWLSPRNEGIYAALYIQVHSLRRLEGMSLAIAILLLEGLQNYEPHQAKIKWPNDLLFDGRKWGGILVETFPPNHVIIGFGLNVDIDSQNIPQITDLQTILRRPIPLLERSQLLAVLLNTIIPALQIFEQETFESYLSRWKRWDFFDQKTVLLTPGDGAPNLCGRAAGLTSTGALRVWLPGEHRWMECGSSQVSVRPES